MNKEYRTGNMLYWYDRSLRLWTITERDEQDNQIGEAMYATSKDEAKVIAHQRLVENQGYGIKALSDMIMVAFK